LNFSVDPRIPRTKSNEFDTCWAQSYTNGMEVRFSPELQEKIDRVAAGHGCDSESLVLEAVERFMNYDEWVLREVEDGLAAADRGEFIEHEEVGKLIESRYRG
jgi:predicted transcriptional regulator